MSVIAPEGSSDPGPATGAADRDALVLAHLPNAQAIARRFCRNGEAFDDLVQVAVEGLLLAAGRFDPEQGTPFGAYAHATMIGTVKRHFRDRGWAVRVPRRVHELAGPVTNAKAILEQDLGRVPTNDEVADLLGVAIDAVDEVLVATHARSVRSIDADEDLGRQLGDPVDAVERSTDRSVLRAAIEAMPADRRYVLVRYFEDGRTQSQIGEEIGRSQMYVSRVIKQSVAELRHAMT